MRVPFAAPYPAVLLRCALLVAGLAIGAPTAGALTLQQYFFELSDRERGAYITGFLDFFLRDTAREAAYKQCMETLGAARLHGALAELVRSDPSFLSYDTMSWLLYEASRLCNQKPPRDLPVAPAPAREAGQPATATETLEPLPHIGPQPAASAEAAAPAPSDPVAALLLSAAAVLCAGAGAYLFYRHRRRGPLFPGFRRRAPKRSVHSPG